MYMEISTTKVSAIVGNRQLMILYALVTVCPKQTVFQLSKVYVRFTVYYFYKICVCAKRIANVIYFHC